MREDRWTVRLPAPSVEAFRRVLVKALTGTEPAPHPHPLPLDLELTTASVRLDHPPERQNVHSTVYENAHVVRSGAGVLYGFTVYSSNAASQFIQVFDLTSAPANGAVPEVVFTVAATSQLGVEWIHGRPFHQGCVIANSTTAPTYTAGVADTFFDVQYL